MFTLRKNAAWPALLFGAVLAAPVAHAYTISTPVSDGCHETITTKALRNVRLELDTAAPLPLTDDEQALVDDLEFSPDDDMQDLGGATLLIAIRDNDLKGNGANDLTELALVHGNPAHQDEHCIRTDDQDEPNGSAQAVEACRNYIRQRVAQALEGLDANGMPDIDKKILLPIHLALRGDIDAPLPKYYVRIGQAMHAIQDSFTHVYRTADGMQITVVLNWIDTVNGDYDEVKDGPSHSQELDVCDDPDALRKQRRLLATEASEELLRATLDPQKTVLEKMIALEVLLDTYLSYKPGCNAKNDWCDAPEQKYANEDALALGCGVLRMQGRQMILELGILFLALAGVLCWLRRGTKLWLRLFLPLLILHCIVGSAQAEEHRPPPPVTVPVPEAGPKDPSKPVWGSAIGGAVSLDKPAIAMQVGVRRRMNTNWTLGGDIEWNPWFSIAGASQIRPGVLNGYATIIYRMPLAYEKFNLRSTLNLGTSYLLFDLFGASQGSLGLYGGISPLGIEWKFSRRFHLISNPLNFALPVPQLDGIPLTYPQYRFSIGLEFLDG